MAALALAAAFAGLASAAPSGPGSTILKPIYHSLPLIITKVHDQVETLTTKLNAAIAAAAKVNGKVNLAVALPVLLQLKQVIHDATGAINTTQSLKLGLDAILHHNGTVLTIPSTARLLATLFIKIIAILRISLKAVIQVKAAGTLIHEIDFGLAAWLQMIFKLVFGIKILWAPLVAFETALWIKSNGLGHLSGLLHV